MFSVNRTVMDHSLSVLLVEDNPEELMVISTQLQQLVPDIEVLTATSAGHAKNLLDHLQRSGRRLPNLAIFDLNLEGQNCLGLLSHIKRDKQLRAIPVIIFSGETDNGAIREAYDHFANGFAIKPSTLPEYLSKLEHIIRFFTSTVTLPY